MHGATALGLAAMDAPRTDLKKRAAENADENGDASDIEDVRLMLRVREGDAEAFEQLVVRHQSAVIGTVAKMMGGVDDAADLAQQVFLRVWKSAARYERQAKFTTWLFTITRNLVFNECRRRYRSAEVSMDAIEEASGRMTEDTAPERPDTAALQTELESAVDAAIAALPEKQRMAVVLRRYEELPYEQIAEILELTVPAVKSLLFRARTQLKESLQQYLDA